MAGWIGVDLDGTLAVYKGWNGGGIGEPVAAMVFRVKHWISQGREVRIVTARVANSGLINDVGQFDGGTFVEEQRRLIEAWCLEHIGEVLPITAAKDFGMIELWDDRCIRVKMNTGEPCCDWEAGR